VKKEYYMLLALLLMVFGEILTIYSEVYAAKLPAKVSENPGMFVKPMGWICVAGISLVLAYWLGYQATGNIWVVTVASLTLLLILEPIVIYAMLRELPQRGAVIGFVLGAIGLIATVAL